MWWLTSVNERYLQNCQIFVLDREITLNCFVCMDMKLSKLKFTILIERQKLLHFHILHNQYFLHFFEWHIEQFVLELFHI